MKWWEMRHWTSVVARKSKWTTWLESFAEQTCAMHHNPKYSFRMMMMMMWHSSEAKRERLAAWHGMAIHYAICCHCLQRAAAVDWLGSAIQKSPPKLQWQNDEYNEGLVVRTKQIYPFYTTVTLPPILIPMRLLFAQATRSSRNEGNGIGYKLEWNRMHWMNPTAFFCFVYCDQQAKLIWFAGSKITDSEPHVVVFLTICDG